MPTDTEIAWAAGLFEGEGWIGMNGVSVSLSIEMADRDVLARYAALVGGAVRGPYEKGPRRRPLYICRIGDRERVRQTCEWFLPWLGERRAAKMRELMPHILPPRPTAPNCGWQGSASHGVTRHTQRGEPPCAQCRERNNEASRRWRRGELIRPARRRPDPDHCSNGHELVGANAIPRGRYVACRECQRVVGLASQQRRRARDRAAEGEYREEASCPTT
jgi:hypothetical protein